MKRQAGPLPVGMESDAPYVKTNRATSPWGVESDPAPNNDVMVDGATTAWATCMAAPNHAPHKTTSRDTSRGGWKVTGPHQVIRMKQQPPTLPMGDGK
jgi:hypothetical protein